MTENRGQITEDRRPVSALRTSPRHAEVRGPKKEVICYLSIVNRHSSFHEVSYDLFETGLNLTGSIPLKNSELETIAGFRRGRR